MEIKGNFIYADKGTYIHRKGSNIYGVQMSLLNGDTIANFEQVYEIPTSKFSEEELAEKRNRIAELKAQLRETDYISLKAFEGGDVSKYGNWKGQRQAIRDEINKLEGEK